MSLLRDTGDLISYIKQIAQEANENGKPVGIFFGEVKTTSPISILVDQKLKLGEKQLMLSSLVQDFTIPVSFSLQTENETGHTHAVQDTYTGGGSSSPTSHLHNVISNKKNITLHFGLSVGEKVILLRMQGGQRFLVLDRVR